MRKTQQELNLLMNKLHNLNQMGTPLSHSRCLKLHQLQDLIKSFAFYSVKDDIKWNSHLYNRRWPRTWGTLHSNISNFYMVNLSWHLVSCGYTQTFHCFQILMPVSNVFGVDCTQNSPGLLCTYGAA